MISEKRLTQALTYLAETDKEAAEARARMIGIENQEKTVLSIAFLGTTGTVAEREAISRTSPEYLEWQKKHEDAVYDYEILRNKRNTESVIIDVWRSFNSARTKGVL